MHDELGVKHSSEQCGSIAQLEDMPPPDLLVSMRQQYTQLWLAFERQVNREHSAYGWNSQSGFDGGTSIPLLDVFYNQSEEEVVFEADFIAWRRRTRSRSVPRSSTKPCNRPWGS